MILTHLLSVMFSIPCVGSYSLKFYFIVSLIFLFSHCYLILLLSLTHLPYLRLFSADFFSFYCFSFFLFYYKICLLISKERPLPRIFFLKESSLFHLSFLFSSFSLSFSFSFYFPILLNIEQNSRRKRNDSVLDVLAFCDTSCEKIFFVCFFVWFRKTKNGLKFWLILFGYLYFYMMGISKQ